MHIVTMKDTVCIYGDTIIAQIKRSSLISGRFDIRGGTVKGFGRTSNRVHWNNKDGSNLLVNRGTHTQTYKDRHTHTMEEDKA